ncbi:MAG: short-chain dehydrogenase/reductase [Subtercola sp.]|nr:short-chain dehydrogenase/reductase [Subtercola sp.]
MLDLSGRRLLVIGAGNGMGRQAAHAVALNGADVVCVDRDPDLAREIAREVGGLGLAADMTKRDEVERVVEAAHVGTGCIDGLIDVVGMARWGALLEIEDESWDFQFDVCLRHAFLTMQIAGRAMKRTGGGTMSFVSSISGISAAPNHAAYGAAKAGLMALVRSGAVELGPSGIRVNAVAPGGTATPRIIETTPDETMKRDEALIPTGRFNKPSEIASALLFLSSDLSQNMTGQTLVVDGGVTARYAFQ